MNNFMSREQVEVLRTKYPAGTKIRIIRMDGEPHYDGRVGTVTHVDDAGGVHGLWGGCAIIPTIDKFEVVK